jgi:hypothetical protein
VSLPSFSWVGSSPPPRDSRPVSPRPWPSSSPRPAGASDPSSLKVGRGMRASVGSTEAAKDVVARFGRSGRCCDAVSPRQRECPYSPGASDRAVNRRPRARAGTAAVPSGRLVLAAGRPPPRSISRIRQVALADWLALRRVGDGMVMVAFGDLIGPPPPCLDGGLG